MTEDQAKSRFLILSLVRIISVLLALFGLAVMQLGLLGELSQPIGGLFLVLGVAEFFFGPILLKKLWQRQDQ